MQTLKARFDSILVCLIILVCSSFNICLRILVKWLEIIPVSLCAVVEWQVMENPAAIVTFNIIPGDHSDVLRIKLGLPIGADHSESKNLIRLF